MGLDFPNKARSYDKSRRCVRFLGYDGLFEVPFFLQADALISTRAGIVEAELLNAFDEARMTIYGVAQKVYARGRQTGYVLTAKDFR
ncbi:DUF1488 domain-containing protein [Nitratireductor rhodophyticola]|uniref:DUF1488 domain-containing protein n=1 Tax=Nitratireductor rhodophyticola TaxID=2854036 RepID=UPI003008E505